MTKKLTRTIQWTNGKFSFPSIYGIKKQFAWNLINMGDIMVPEKDVKEALKNPVKYLESHGWSWEVFHDDIAK